QQGQVGSLYRGRPGAGQESPRAVVRQARRATRPSRTATAMTLARFKSLALQTRATMRAMLLDAAHAPLRPAELPRPTPGPDQVLVHVRAGGVCRTDLHVADGELPDPKLPLVLGHEVVGVVAAKGERVERFARGDRVGVPWLGWTCGECVYCRSGREN